MVYMVLFQKEKVKNRTFLVTVLCSNRDLLAFFSYSQNILLLNVM